MSKTIYIGKMDRPSVGAMTGDDGFVRLECRCFEVDSDALRALVRRHIPRLSMPKQWVLQQRYTQFGRVGQWTFFDHYNTYREALCKASQLLRWHGPIEADPPLTVTRSLFDKMNQYKPVDRRKVRTE